MRSINTGGEMFTVAFDPAQDRLAAGGADGAIRLWNIDKVPSAGGAVPADTTLQHAHVGGVMSVTFSPKGDLIASGGADNMVRLWNARTPSPLPELTTLTGRGHTAAVTSVAFNRDGTRVVSGGNDKTVQLWDVGSRQRIGDPMIGHEGLVLSVAFIADGNEIVSGGNEHALRFWNAVVGQPPSEPLAGHQGPVTSVAISNDGRQIASAGVDGTVRLWNADTGTPIKQMPERGGVITRVAFNRAGDMVASGSADGKIRLWQPKTDTVRVLEAGRPISAIALSQDGDRLVSAGIDGQITIWELPSGRPTPLVNKDHAVVFDVAFDPPAHRVASGGVAGVLRVWDLNGSQSWASDAVAGLLEAFRGGNHLAGGRPGAVLSVAFSADGQRVASASADWTAKETTVGVVQRWDANDGNPLGEPTSLGSAVMGLALSPQTADPAGDRIVAGSFDPYIVQLWNAGPANGDRLTLAGHQAQVVSVAISADGGRIVSGSVDGTVRIWSNPPAIPSSEALCHKLTTTMSPKNWDDWVSAAVPYQDICSGLPPTPDPPPS